MLMNGIDLELIVWWMFATVIALNLCFACFILSRRLMPAYYRASRQILTLQLELALQRYCESGFGDQLLLKDVSGLRGSLLSKAETWLHENRRRVDAVRRAELRFATGLAGKYAARAYGRGYAQHVLLRAGLPIAVTQASLRSAKRYLRPRGCSAARTHAIAELANLPGHAGMVFA